MRCCAAKQIIAIRFWLEQRIVLRKNKYHGVGNKMGGGRGRGRKLIGPWPTRNFSQRAYMYINFVLKLKKSNQIPVKRGEAGIFQASFFSLLLALGFLLLLVNRHQGNARLGRGRNAGGGVSRLPQKTE